MKNLLKGLLDELSSVETFYIEREPVKSGERVVACFAEDDELKRVFTVWHTRSRKAEEAYLDVNHANTVAEREKAIVTFNLQMAATEMWKRIFVQIALERYQLSDYCGIAFRAGYQIVSTHHGESGFASSLMNALTHLEKELEKGQDMQGTRGQSGNA